MQLLIIGGADIKVKGLYFSNVTVFLFLKYYMKLKNEHFWLLIFALNFISFQLVQDYIRPQYMGNNIPIKYFLGIAPNFFPAIGIPSLFMVLIPILLINKPNSWFVLKRHLSSNLVSVTGLIGWEILQVTGKLVFDWHDILWTILGALLFQLIWKISSKVFR